MDDIKAVTELFQGLTTPPERRAGILELEAALAQVPGALFGDNATCPLTHQFAGHLYVRTIRIPAGMLCTGKIHRYSHPHFLQEGEAMVFTEQGGREHLVAPLVMISPPGTKRAVYALTDVVWTTVHEVGDERDLAKIEQMLIAPDFLTLEEGAVCPSLPLAPLLPLP